ncbi:MAG TPA: MlaE family lipid ABC transporter permease subunit [Candidatus Binatia bacterium]|nr:MlaE family lipid ABC transporter permease subunit [Candidatus Binatia bacterium]
MSGVAGAVRELGYRSLVVVAQLGSLLVFAGAIVRAFAAPPYRLRRWAEEIFNLGVLSLVIICVSGLAVGMVLGLQGYNTLVRFGAESSLGAVVGLSLIRELGPVLSALLVTGRAGSATAAEIASMVTTEQIDGLRMMSVDPIEIVVMPKASAMLFVMPVLSTLFILFGIGGAYVIGVHLMGLDAGIFLSSLTSAVRFSDDVVGSLVKGLIFGALIGLIATFRGYHARPTSAGVSSATTSTVVITSVAILITDYFVTALWGFQI